MKKCRQFLMLLLFCILCFWKTQVYADELTEAETIEAEDIEAEKMQAQDIETKMESELETRLNKAKKLGLETWIDQEGYLVDSFFEGKSDKEISELGVDGLVRMMSLEDLDAYVELLNAGISMYTVTHYEKVGQVNPSTGRYLYTGFFQVDGMLAFCIERSVSTPPKGSPTGEWIPITNEKLRKVLYYGYNGPKNLGYTYVETALAAGEANGDGDNALGRNVLAEIVQNPVPPENFKVWKVETNGGTTQDLAFYTIEEIEEDEEEAGVQRLPETGSVGIYATEIVGSICCTMAFMKKKSRRYLCRNVQKNVFWE